MKKIASYTDLAVSGAPPAYGEPLHVGRPNIGNRKRFLTRVNEILQRRWLTNNGPAVQELEQKIAAFLHVRHCVAMCNGTIALEIAIRALDLKGEVVVPSFTFVATAHALQWQEITPVFADIDPSTHNLDPESVRRSITARTTGIIGVHLWGRAAPVSKLQAIADEYGLRLLFDASHAFGCTYRGVPIGRFGQCEVFSFHATKFFSTFEGGCIATNDDSLADKLRFMRNFGFAGFDNVIYPGTNGKMSEIAAAFGLTNLEDLAAFVERNKKNYNDYQAALSAIPNLSLLEFDSNEHNNYQYVVVEVQPKFPVPRDEIVHVFHAENILVRKYFWPGAHNMLPYKTSHPSAAMNLPSTERVASRVLVFPTGSAIGENDIGVIAAIFRVLGRQVSVKDTSR